MTGFILKVCKADCDKESVSTGRKKACSLLTLVNDGAK